MTTSKNIRYIPAIDHLRAYAALLVLLFHVFDRGASVWPKAGNPFMSLLYEGHTGVALFLVLSGFIFTFGSAGREIEYKTFLRNRALRIYPLMITLTCVAVSAGAHLDAVQIIESLLPVQILMLPVQSDPGAVFIQVFWTITVELQFYLLFPFLYRQLLQRGVFGLVPLLVFLLLARWSAFLLGSNPQIFSYFTILGRLDQFLVGMFAATVARRLTLDSRLLRWALPVGIVGLMTALWFFNRGGGFPAVVGWKIVWPTLEAVLWALIILGYLALLHGKNHPILRAIAGVGTVSYSMYLLHSTVITIVEKYGFVFHFSKSPFLGGCLTGLVCVFPLTLLVSILTYHTIEKPFLGLRRRYLEPGPTLSSSTSAPPVAAENWTETAEPFDLRWPLAWLLAAGVAAVVVVIFLYHH